MLQYFPKKEIGKSYIFHFGKLTSIHGKILGPMSCELIYKLKFTSSQHESLRKLYI